MTSDYASSDRQLPHLSKCTQFIQVAGMGNGCALLGSEGFSVTSAHGVITSSSSRVHQQTYKTR